MINEILNVDNVNKNITENKLNFFGKIIKSFINEDENKIDNSKEKTFNQTNKLKQNLMFLLLTLPQQKEGKLQHFMVWIKCQL